MAENETISCHLCSTSKDLDFDITMAFQPIIDIDKQIVYAYEALVRGLNNESAYFILKQVNQDNMYFFDQKCRVKAIEIASKLGIQERLHINFLPNAMYSPETCIKKTLDAAKKYNLSTSQITFEFTENEQIHNFPHIGKIIREYQKFNFKTAIDDFGAGYAGLNWLVKFQPDLIKLDLQIIRDIHQEKVKQSIVKGILNVCEEIGIRVIAEGIEKLEEMNCLLDMGIKLFQGYLFAKPGFESFPQVNFPAILETGY
jgi:EAL domain-containing protein (putative c-di-GMP-specific phosphodiesterase class I)